MATQLQSRHDLLVSHVTTDGDALSSKGIAEAYHKAGIDLKVTNYADLTHKGACQRKRIMNMDLAVQSFGVNPSGKKWLSCEKSKCQQALANDIELRCAITLRKMFTHYNNNIQKIQQQASKVVDYMMKCYRGDHSKCKSALLSKLTGCEGRPGHTWFDISTHLCAQGLTGFSFTPGDSVKIRHVIELKLGAANVPTMAQLHTTQKVESVNRAINISDPKNFHFSRNAKGRNHSAVHRVNNGPAKSINLKFEAGSCALPSTSMAAKAINSYDRKLQYSKSYKQQFHIKLRQRQLKSEKIRNYYHSAARNNNPSDYFKHQLDDARQQRNLANHGSQHSRAHQLVKAAKRNLRTHQKEERKKKLAASMKRRRTWIRNSQVHAANRKNRLAKRHSYYNTGSDQSQHVKSEHSYPTWK